MENSNTPRTLVAAWEYIRMGWALLPVEGLKGHDDDRCLCGAYPCGIDNRKAGKHPAGGRSGWQSGPALTSQEVLHIWEDCPDYNVGARTGAASGFFAMDVEAEGMSDLAELEARHGQLPPTRVHRTGSGGRHYLFLAPDFPVRNSVKKLAPGIDIRGDGGMIIVPPSVSAKGAYEVERDAPIVAAPEWLLDWLRAGSSDDESRIGDLTPVEGLPAYSDLSPERQAECQRYALAVIERETQRYREAPAGSGNAELFSAACNILEIVQSPWNLYTAHDAERHLENARRERIEANPGRGQDREEFTKTVRSARLKVLGNGRPLPPDRTESLMLDVPFSPAGGDDEGGAAGTNDPFMDPDGSTTPGSIAPDAVPPAGGVDPVEALMAEMLDRDGLDALSRPQPLIWDVLDKDSESWLIAPSGGFKSFIALDMAMHVAMGLPWRGKKVDGGPVVYIVAEGSKGIGMRVEAWEKVYGRRSEGVRYLPRPVQVSDPEGGWKVLVEACRRIGPAMIVIDTQARVTVGIEENSAKEVGVFIRAISELREATRACVLVVHHTGKSGLGARGSSALYAAADTELRVERPEKREERLQLTATISTSKQKDMEEDTGFQIEMERVDLGLDPHSGRPLSSLALKPYDPFWTPPDRPEPEHRANLVPNQAAILEVLREHANNEYGATNAEIRAFIKETKGYEMHRGSCGTALDALIKSSLITRIGQRFVLSENVEI